MQRIETLNGNYLCRHDDGTLTYRNAVGEHVRYETSPDMWEVAVETWSRPVEMGRWVENEADPKTWNWVPEPRTLSLYESVKFAEDPANKAKCFVVMAAETAIILIPKSVKNSIANSDLLAAIDNTDDRFSMYYDYSFDLPGGKGRINRSLSGCSFPYHRCANIAHKNAGETLARMRELIRTHRAGRKFTILV